MNLRVSPWSCICAAIGALVVMAPHATRSAVADDFKVETKIYVGDKKTPASTNITRFQNGIVWDFAGDGSEIVMFDKARGRFTIMDLQRKVRTEVATDEVLKFTQQLRDWASQQEDDPLLKFCAAPRLEKVAGKTPDSVTFSSPLLSYQIVTQRPENPEVALRYREFSDWYARVNTLFRPGALPPFPRLMVNEHLGRDELVPQRVKLTLAAQPSHGNRAMTVHSEQNFVIGLMQSDVEQINRASGYLVVFQEITLEKYRQDPAPAQK